MNETIATLINITSSISYILAIIAAITLPLWGYRIIEEHLGTKHKALKTQAKSIKTSSIVASIGTTTAGVFLIQILPLIFSVIGDVGQDFSIGMMFGDYMADGMGSMHMDSFYGLTARLGDMLQTVAPMGAVGLGGYNLLNNISRGLPA
jgi:hypothetical protein